MNDTFQTNTTEVGHISTLPLSRIKVRRSRVRHTVENQMLRTPHIHGDSTVAASPTHDESIRVGAQIQVDERAARGIKLRLS